MQERNKGPHTEVGNPGQRREARGRDLNPGLARVAARARSHPKEAFNSLMHHLTPELIAERLNKMPFLTSAGVDEMTATQARKNLDWLLPPIMEQMHQGKYEAPPVRRVYIPKVDGSKRPIGIPTVIDRAIQGSVARILEPTRGNRLGGDDRDSEPISTASTEIEDHVWWSSRVRHAVSVSL